MCIDAEEQGSHRDAVAWSVSSLDGRRRATLTVRAGTRVRPKCIKNKKKLTGGLLNDPLMAEVHGLGLAEQWGEHLRGSALHGISRHLKPQKRAPGCAWASVHRTFRTSQTLATHQRLQAPTKALRHCGGYVLAGDDQAAAFRWHSSGSGSSDRNHRRLAMALMRPGRWFRGIHEFVQGVLQREGGSS